MITNLVAANPGPAAHIALLGVVIVVGLIVYAVVRVRRKREAAEAQALDEQPIADSDGAKREPSNR